MAIKEKISKCCRNLWDILKGIELKFRSSDKGEILIDAKSSGLAEFKYEKKDGSSEISLNIDDNIGEKKDM